MAIQFQCPGCLQPIEVDDPYAGQTAACPYCRRVVTVPQQSTLQAPAVTARPTPAAAGAAPAAAPGIPPLPPAGALHVGPTATSRERSARNFGNYALVCAVLCILLFAGTFIYGIGKALKSGLLGGDAQPSAADVAAFQREMAQNVWAGAAQIGALFFACVGLALGITSLVQSRRNNWRGVLSVVLCGLFMLCLCSATALALAGVDFGPVPA